MSDLTPTFLSMKANWSTMANSSKSSSLTSTSHTLTNAPTVVKQSTEGTTMTTLLEILAPQNRHLFVAPTPSIVSSSLAFAKGTLDSFAGKLGDEQAEKLKEQRKKRKRGDRDGGELEREVLKIRRVHVEGFEVEQVWEQARRVIGALREDAEVAFGELDLPHEDERAVEEVNGNGGVELLKFDEDGFEVGSHNEDTDEAEDEAPESASDEDDIEDQELASEVGDDDDAEEGLDENEDDYDQEEGDEETEAAGVFLPDPNGLNDGFFSIDDFNKQTEFLERQDAAADPYTGEASDEEEIDWDIDPTSLPSKPDLNSRRAAAMDIEDEEDEDMEDEEDEDGPTFGNVDLNAPEGDSDEDDMNDGVDEEGDNTNTVYYKEFFEPPPRKLGKGERQANYLERQSRKPKAVKPEEDEADLERAMADVRRDLFDEESDQDNSSEDALSELDPADPKSRRSAHERKQAKLAEEIRRLEAASVSKREWTLSGEAKAADRPLNSLIDQDLDFEHTGKPIPVITAEVSESMEELIKQRILSMNFDEPIRRRPDSVGASGNARRGLFELDDSKPQQSLAEMYEEEHVKANNPDTYVSKADEKLRKEEKEIEGLWKDISAKLDALSSWHYKPKPAAPSLTVVADVATVSMEDAQPTTASGINGGDSMLAPQEIYKAGKNRDAIEKGEVVPKSGAPVARQEMTREEKLRRRRREKERIRKRGGLEADKRPEGKKAQAKKETLGDLKKGGVKVIGRKGDIKDIDGNKVKAATALNGAGGFKL